MIRIASTLRTDPGFDEPDDSQRLGSPRHVFTVRTSRHNDLDHLEQILRIERDSHGRCLIVVEGLYSMDGDVPDLPRLLAMKEAHDRWLMVDEAHSIGVLGLDAGLAIAHGVVPVFFRDDAETVACAEAMLLRGYYCPPIVQVGMPRDQPRLRFFLSVQHREQDVAEALDIAARACLTRSRDQSLLHALRPSDAAEAGACWKVLFPTALKIWAISPLVPDRRALVRPSRPGCHEQKMVGSHLRKIGRHAMGCSRLSDVTIRQADRRLVP